MRISRPSANRLIMLAVLLSCTAASAQDGKAEGGSQAIQSQGDAAMDRLKQALISAKQSDQAPSPRLPGPPSKAERRRAFEAMRNRVSAPQIDARVRSALNASEAKIAAEREEQGKRLRQALGLEPNAIDALAKANPPSTPNSWVPVLFVSSSMPIGALRTYAAQVERAQGVMAFRGMPGGLRKVGPVAKLSAEILRTDPGCAGPDCAMRNVQLIVDPIAFRQHGATRVPALVMIPGDPTQAYCEREDESPKGGYIVYGDSALSGLVDEIARLGGDREVRDVQAALGAR